MADDAVMIAPAPAPAAPRFVFTLRGGVSMDPEYFGSEDYEVGPDVGFRFNYLSLRNGREFGNPDPWAENLGFGVGGSFRFVGERDSGDFDELAGLDDIDPAVELGVSLNYGTENFNTFAAVRRGFGGHEGWVGEIGADAVMRPTDRLRLSLGPRVFFGDEEYSNTYFGITADEASAALPTYELDGGLVSAGVEFGARYQINDVWGLEGAVTWEKFQNDAADSPIVEQGDDEQWGVRFGVTRVFSIGG
ncbi:MipA/OmpV family protein [Marivita hallyeonensis]|nr:MipA/OmpV family protein [Marivita hallyeonensis]